MKNGAVGFSLSLMVDLSWLSTEVKVKLHSLIETCLAFRQDKSACLIWLAALGSLVSRIAIVEYLLFRFDELIELCSVFRFLRFLIYW